MDERVPDTDDDGALATEPDPELNPSALEEMDDAEDATQGLIGRRGKRAQRGRARPTVKRRTT